MTELSVLLYHGTTEEGYRALSRATHALERIQRLGKGTYFWENTPEYAAHWARHRNPEKKTAVFCAQLAVSDTDQVLDLTCPYERGRFARFVDHLEDNAAKWRASLERLDGLGHPGRSNMGGYLIDLYIKYSNRDVRAVRGIHKILNATSPEFAPPSLNKLKEVRRQLKIDMESAIRFEFGYTLFWAVRDLSILRPIP